MISFDRRASDRRGIASPTTISLGAVLADERRDVLDRRGAPRRRSDLITIAHVVRRIDAGQPHLDVLVDFLEGLRLVATFACGCRASEPVGTGSASVHLESCAAHAAPAGLVERRRSRH